MDIIRWMLGGPTRADYDGLMRAYTERIREAYEARVREDRARSCYLDLRRALTSRACANGIDNPTIEPLARILKEHDKKMSSCGFSVPR